MLVLFETPMQIADLGAAAFADSLRFKATGSLTSLDLTRNLIGDDGAESFKSAFQVCGEQ
jgi:hypothetical protein